MVAGLSGGLWLPVLMFLAGGFAGALLTALMHVASTDPENRRPGGG